MIRAGVVCDNCGNLIPFDKDIYYRKGCVTDEAFCSRVCLHKYVLENLDFRLRKFDIDIDGANDE